MSAAETHICIDPRLSGSGKEADYWLNLEPGTDGALALAWQHILIEKDLIDWEFVKRWTDASLLVVEDMEPTGGRYLDLSSPIQVPALQDLIGTKLKTRLLKEMDLVEGGSPHKFMAWNKKANDGKGGLVYWDTDTTQWQGCNHVAPTRDQMEVVYAGTSQEGYLPPISYWELEEAGIDFDLEGEHEVTLADGTKHIARRCGATSPSRWPIARRSGPARSPVSTRSSSRSPARCGPRVPRARPTATAAFI